MPSSECVCFDYWQSVFRPVVEFTSPGEHINEHNSTKKPNKQKQKQKTKQSKTQKTRYITVAVTGKHK